MKIMKIQWVMGLAMVITFIAGISCSNKKVEEKAVPPGHENRVEEYRKGVETSKVIVIAEVNGSDITMNNLINTMNRIAPKYIKAGQQRTPQIDETIKDQALRTLVLREVAVQEALRQGLKASPEIVDARVNKMRQGAGSDEAFKKSLEMMGYSEATFRVETMKDILFEMAVEKKFPYVEGKSGTPAALERQDDWLTELSKKAKIEIYLAQVEKKLKEEGERSKKETTQK